MNEQKVDTRGKNALNLKSMQSLYESCPFRQPGIDASFTSKLPNTQVKISMSMKKLTLVCCALLIGGTISAQTKMWKKIKEELVFENAPFKQCHASTLVQTQTGELLLAFFGGSQEGKNDVSIWLCKLEDGKKADPIIVADGVVSDTLRYPTWNPVLFKASTGKLFLFYKVGPNPRDWWGMVKTSNDNGI